MQRSARSLAMLAVLGSILAACGGTGAGSPIASPTSTPMPSESESPEPSATPKPSFSPAPSEDDAPTPAPNEPAAIAVDRVVRTLVEGLRLREDPTTGAPSLGTLSGGAMSYVVDGPVMADGYAWYLVSGMGIPQFSGCAGPLETDPWVCPVWFGWAAAGSPDGDAWLAEVDPDCPTWPEVVTEEISYGVPRIAYLACFGSEERSLVGFYPEIPDDAGLGGACAEVPDEMAWIACNLGYDDLGPTEASPMGSGFIFSVHPSVTLPERGQWLRVTGRFSHPDAQHCMFGDVPEQPVLNCRAQFVVEQAEVVPAP